jgi:hypothetical protein
VLDDGHVLGVGVAAGDAHHRAGLADGHAFEATVVSGLPGGGGVGVDRAQDVVAEHVLGGLINDGEAGCDRGGSRGGSKKDLRGSHGARGL